MVLLLYPLVWFNMSANHLANRIQEKSRRGYRRFPALGVDCMFSCAWCRLHVFLRLVPIACSPTLGADCMSFHACCLSYVFSRLVPIACSPAFSSYCMFSRVWCQLHVFLRLVQIACFPALGADCMHSRAWCRLHVLPRWRRSCQYLLYGLTGSCSVSICRDWLLHLLCCLFNITPLKTTLLS